MRRHLRIALVLETSGGGSGRHVLDLARGLVGDGHDVSVIWSPGRARPEFVSQLQSIAGITDIPVAMQRSVGPNDLVSARMLAAQVQSRAPFDIVHGHSSKAGALVRLMPRDIPGARIYTPHAFRTMDPGLRPPMRQVYATIERMLSERAARIITVSRAEYDHALSIGISPRRLTTVVNGVALPPDATRQAARDMMGLGPGDVAVGFLGRLETQKDPLRFVRAVNHAARIAPAVKGVVIGDGPLRAAAEDMADAGAVRFMGWQDGPRLMPGLDVYCMTSGYEAMPYTLIEALHAQVPIVATAVGGTHETVVENRNGHVVPLECAADMIGDRLAALANDTARRQAFGAASGHLAASCTLETMVNRTVRVYQRALAAETPALAKVS